MSIDAVRTSVASPVAYDRSGSQQHRPRPSVAHTAAVSDAMRVELTSHARAAAARSAVTNATAEAAASANFFASFPGFPMPAAASVGSGQVDRRI